LSRRSRGRRSAKLLGASGRRRNGSWRHSLLRLHSWRGAWCGRWLRRRRRRCRRRRRWRGMRRRGWCSRGRRNMRRRRHGRRGMGGRRRWRRRGMGRRRRWRRNPGRRCGGRRWRRRPRRRGGGRGRGTWGCGGGRRRPRRRRRSLRRLLGLSFFLLGLGHDQRRGLRVRWRGDELHRGQGSRGKQHETKVCHDGLGPRKFPGEKALAGRLGNKVLRSTNKR
jgi:hypothetical protein